MQSASGACALGQDKPQAECNLLRSAGGCSGGPLVRCSGRREGACLAQVRVHEGRHQRHVPRVGEDVEREEESADGAGVLRVHEQCGSREAVACTLCSCRGLLLAVCVCTADC